MVAPPAMTLGCVSTISLALAWEATHWFRISGYQIPWQPMGNFTHLPFSFFFTEVHSNQCGGGLVLSGTSFEVHS